MFHNRSSAHLLQTFTCSAARLWLLFSSNEHRQSTPLRVASNMRGTVQVVVMVEVVPLLKQQMVCAVAMLPNSMISSAHKLKIKATSANEEASKQQDGRKQ